MKHTLIMLIGCALPLLLIFLLPAIGVSGGWLLFVAVSAMFACHLAHLWMHKGGAAREQENERP